MELNENGDALSITCKCGETKTYYHHDLAAAGIHHDTLARRHRASSLIPSKRIGRVIGRRLYFSKGDLKELGYDPSWKILHGMTDDALVRGYASEILDQ